MSEQKTVELNEEDRKQLLTFFEKLDTSILKNVAEALSMMVRAFDGRPIEPDDIITKLVNVKDITERSNFPTYPLLAKQVYLRLIALYNPQGYPCKDWADFEARALTSYKGLSREQYVEMTKSAIQTPEQQFYLGDNKPRAPEQEPKTHFWNRKPKEQSEFVHQ